MQNRSRLFLASMFAGLLWQGSAAAETISLSSPSGAVGSTVDVAINYVSGTATSLNFDIMYDQTKVSSTSTTFATGTVPNDVSVSDPAPGKITVLVSPKVKNPMPIVPTGTLGTIQLNIKAGATGPIALTISNVVMANAAGTAIPATSITTTNGAITVITGTVTVPNLGSMTEAAARAAITNAKLTVGTVTQAFSDTVAADNVISQDPAAGQTVAENRAVNLVVSKGKDPGTGGQKILPNVVGMTEAAARANIPAGVTVVVNTAYSSTVPVGQIISQTPAAGVLSATITITVSLGPLPLAGAAAPVPTLSEWALMLLVLAVGTVVWMRKPQQG